MLGLALREVRLRDPAPVVHQHVQATELVLRKRDHPRRAGLGGHIHADERGPSSPGCDLTYSAGAGVFVGIRDDDGRPHPGESPGNRPSYPGSSTGNHSDFAPDLQRAISPSSWPASGRTCREHNA